MSSYSHNSTFSEPWGIHWFRRDLRVAGNPGLRFNWQKTKGRTLGIFCFDSTFLSRPDFSHNRFQFFLETLDSLKKELQQQGGDLLVVDSLPLKAFSQLLAHFDQNQIPRPQWISWNRDYEPFAKERDQKISDFFRKQNLSFETFRDHLLFEPHEVLKTDRPGDFYQIYSPFARKWLQQLATPEGQSRLKSQDKNHSYYSKLKKKKLDKGFQIQWKTLTSQPHFPFQDSLQYFLDQNKKHVTIPIPQAGSHIAFQKLQSFKNHLESYSEQRDFPAIAGTSQLSIYLKNGSLTSAQIIQELNLGRLNWGSQSHAFIYLKEIIWREFYYSILFHRPDVEHNSFLSQYSQLKWENNKSHFEKWKQGETGFPIVDAGMRQLLTTGWMHNRIRMIVASFLVKDLLIDWRWGENHFMKYLLDGDLAPNNGGWQWAASTGCDPQPYFRIFNPWLQSAKFDPQGEYIKKYIPELREIPSRFLHDPDLLQGHYIQPLVDHKTQKNRAILLFKSTPSHPKV